MFNKAKDLSKAFKDRPLEPLETAIYWIEYVINNKGGDLMRPYSVHMPCYTYYALDVICFLILVKILAIYVLIKISKLIYCKLCKKDGAKLKVN